MLRLLCVMLLVETAQQVDYEATGPCMDMVDNCDKYGRGVCSDYRPWATAHCAAYCGFCTGAPTTTPPPCVNTIPNCAEYGTYICHTTSVVAWAKEHCRKYCNFCGDSSNHTYARTVAATVATTKGTQGQTTGCGNTVSNCADYGRSACTNYKPWATAHCAAYCGFCTDAATTTAPACVNQIPNCVMYGTYFCKPTMAKWAHTNCRLYCKFCSP